MISAITGYSPTVTNNSCGSPPCTGPEKSVTPVCSITKREPNGTAVVALPWPINELAGQAARPSSSSCAGRQFCSPSSLVAIPSPGGRKNWISVAASGASPLRVADVEADPDRGALAEALGREGGGELDRWRRRRRRCEGCDKSTRQYARERERCEEPLAKRPSRRQATRFRGDQARLIPTAPCMSSHTATRSIAQRADGLDRQ